MCGIVGYLGKKRPANFLIKKLKKLEYRGYDSAGFTEFDNDEFVTIKSVGSINNLDKKVDENVCVSCAISHTRWATHGKPSEKNAHPQISKNSKWAVVHNGIIENYKELMTELKLDLSSETDTAVIAEMLEKENVKTIEKFIDVFNKLDGSFGVVAICKNLPQTLFLAKKKSPLYVAKNQDGEWLVASDPVCFNGFSNEYYSLNDNEYAIINGSRVDFYNSNKHVLQKVVIGLDGILEQDNKGDYPHFMIKEIYEQPKVLKDQVEFYLNTGLLKKYDIEFFKRFEQVMFIGCGTAYHAGLVGARFIEKILNMPARAEMASEFISKKPFLLNKNCLCIFISQSGETADTISAFELVKNRSITSVCVTNVLYSTLAKKCDYVLPVCAGREIAVASTKAYLCMLGSIYMFAMHLNNLKNNIQIDFYKELKQVTDKLFDFDEQKITSIAERIKNTAECFFIGKDLDYITAVESALKLKEVTYINANAYPSGELKHGYLALVSDKTNLIVIASDESTRLKTINSANEAKARGAYDIIVTTDKRCLDKENAIVIRECDSIFAPMLAIVPMQLLAYKVSVLKNINPDMPRNLAKSVTVE